MYMMIVHYDNDQYYMLMQEYTAMTARYTSWLYISFMPTMFKSHTSPGACVMPREFLEESKPLV